MAKVTHSDNCSKAFLKDLKMGRFSEDDGRVLKAWVFEMEEFGPQYIVDSSQWRDHPLDRQWIGYRASCFSSSGRIIYRLIDSSTVEVCVVERITPNHDYKKEEFVYEKYEKKKNRK